MQGWLAVLAVTLKVSAYTNLDVAAEVPGLLQVQGQLEISPPDVVYALLALLVPAASCSAQVA